MEKTKLDAIRDELAIAFQERNGIIGTDVCFKFGWDAAMERVKPCIYRLERIVEIARCWCNKWQPNKVCTLCEAKEALAKFRGDL